MSYKTLVASIVILILYSCVADDDYSVPDTSISAPVLEGPEISIAAVAGQLAQEQGNTELDYTDEATIYTYEFETQAQYMVGYVVSSDEGGNFFEEIIVQDQPKNPTIGIKILLDVTPLSVRYDPGRKIYLQLNGLSTGITNGVLTVGLRNGNSVDNIPASLENDLLQRSPEVDSIVPLPIGINEFEDDKTNLFIRLENVQFNRNLVLGERPLTYASESFDEFDGNRLLESCSSNQRTILSTSTFADFKALSLPSGRGSLNAVLTKDFFGDTFNVRVNSPEDVHLNLEERCDPDFLDCPGAIADDTILYFEDFQDFEGFEEAGWTNINISGGNRDWSIGSFEGNSYAQITGFNADEDPIDVWLVSPGVNLDSSQAEALTFDIQASFDNGTILSVYASEDFSGDPQSASWIPLDVLIPIGPPGGFGNFQTIAPVNISCLNGLVHFGFFYEGADPGATTRYHIDNLSITGD